MKLFGLLLLLASIAAFSAMPGAYGRPPPDADLRMAPWFQSLRNPVTGLSCCGQSDGHVLSDSQWRIGRDGYEIRVRGRWEPVPPEAILNGVDNPTGGVVAFFPPDGNPIYCFVREAEG